MKNKQHTSHAALLASLVTLLATGFANADEERDLLLKKSAEKRNAMILAKVGNTAALGCFIGKDGLAVFGLVGFAGDKAPEGYFLLDRTPLSAPTFRYLSPEFGVAIAKFNHRPKVWIEPSAEAVPLGLQVAILDPLFEVGPVAIGPVTSKTKATPGNYLHPTFLPVLGIGAGLPAALSAPPSMGCPIIDSAGRLRGTFSATRHLGGQHLLNAVSSHHWFTGIAKARKAKTAIPLPLPPELNPFDPASQHPSFRGAVIASQGNDFEQALKLLKSALIKHPHSPVLHSLRFETANMANHLNDLPALAEATKPPAGGTAAEFVSYHLFRAKACRRTNDHKGSGEALRKALELAPKEHSGLREEYADWLMRDGQPEESLRYLREAVEACPDNIQLLGMLRQLLGHLKKPEEAGKIRDRIFDLEDLYRPTTSSQLRPKRK